MGENTISSCVNTLWFMTLSIQDRPTKQKRSISPSLVQFDRENPRMGKLVVHKSIYRSTCV